MNKAKNSKGKTILLSKALRSIDIEMEVDSALGKFEAGDSHGAEKILHKLNKRNSNNPFVNYGLGIVAAFSGNNNDAILFFNSS